MNKIQVGGLWLQLYEVQPVEKAVQISGICGRSVIPHYGIV